MAKTKQAILSLGASGTIADTLTFQRRKGIDFVRKKPVPAYRETFPQLYQRWLYRDYAYLWTLQDAATRAEYRTAGSRFHLTGFQYWMKYWLSNLPNIVGWWPFYEGSGSIVHDFASHHNHGDLLGTTWQSLPSGLQYLSLAGAGTITIPDATFLDLLSGFTLEIWFKAAACININIAIKGSAYHFFTQAAHCMLAYIRGTGGGYIGRGAPLPTALNDNIWHLLHMTYDGGTTSASVRLYKDTIRVDATNYQGGAFVAPATSLFDLVLGTNLVGNLTRFRVIGKPLTEVERSNHYYQQKYLFGL